LKIAPLKNSRATIAAPYERSSLVIRYLSYCTDPPEF
jgi:hypothetical protein